MKSVIVMLMCAVMIGTPISARANINPRPCDHHVPFRTSGQDCCETCPDDCQAYHAHHYRPNPVPQLIFIAVVVGIVAAILNVNKTHGHVR